METAVLSCKADRRRSARLYIEESNRFESKIKPPLTVVASGLIAVQQDSDIELNQLARISDHHQSGNEEDLPVPISGLPW